MLDEKDIYVLKQKACEEIAKLRQKVEPMTEIPRADWESLVLALKAYEKLLIIENMEMTGYSGHVWDDMMRHATPREREYYSRMYRR